MLVPPASRELGAAMVAYPVGGARRGRLRRRPTVRWAINQITLAGGSRRPPGDLPGDLAALRAGGWEALEVWLPHWDAHIARHGLGAARRLLEDSGLPAAGGCGAGDFFFVRGHARAEAFAMLEERLEQVRELGARHLVVAPGFAEPA